MYRQNFQQKMRELGISVDDAVKPGERVRRTSMRLPFPSVQPCSAARVMQWMGRRERRSPAPSTRPPSRSVSISTAASGARRPPVLYMRGKLAAELERRSDGARPLRRELDAAVDRDEDDIALLLIPRADAAGLRGRAHHGGARPS
jgi:hypothetical protein